MDNKMQIEISIKDNLSKQLEQMSKNVKKAANSMKQQINAIQEAFNNISIKTDVSKQVNKINKEIDNIGKKAKDIQVNVKANVSGLDNLKDQDINVNTNVEQTGDLGSTSSILQAGTVSQMGALGNQLSKGFERTTSSVERLAKALSGMSEKTKQSLGVGIQETKVYAENLKALEKLFNILKIETNDLLIDEDNIEVLNLIEEEVKKLETYFSSLKLDLNIEDVRGVLPVLDKIKETIQKIRDANVMPEDSGKIKIDTYIDVTDLGKEIKKVTNSNAIKSESKVKITPRIEKMSELADTYASIKQQMKDVEFELQVNTEGLDAAMQELKSLRSIPVDVEDEQAVSKLLNLQDEVERLKSICSGLKGELDHLNGVSRNFIGAFAELANQSDFSFNLQMMSSKFKGFVSDLKSGNKTISSVFTGIKNSIKNSIPTMSQFKDGVKSAFSTLKTNIVSKIADHFKKLKNSMSETKKSADKLKSSMSGLKSVLSKLGLFFGISQLIGFGKQAIQTASDVEEAQNVIDVTFGNSSDTISKWAKENASAFGLTELQAKNFAGTFGTIFQAAGVNGDYIDDMSMKLSQLAGDLASFRNLSVEDAFEKLRAGIVGSSEPLQNLGYNMSVAAMDAYLMSQGINASFSELSEASKQVVRFNYIMQQTKSIQGDYANTMNSFANSVRNLKNSFAVFSSEVGQTLIAALTPVIRVIATVIQWLTALARVFNSVLRGFGLIKGAASSAGSAMSAITGGGAGVGGGGIGDVSGIEDTSGAIGGIGDAAEDSAGSVEKLKKEVKGLMGIDEINKLPAPEEDSGSGGSGGSGGAGGGAGGAGGAGGIDVPLDLGLVPNIDDSYTGIIEDKIEEMMEKIKAYLATFDWEPLKESFMRLYESVKPIIEKIGQVLKWLWDEILNPLLHFIVEEIAPRIADSLANLFNILNPILEVVIDNFKVFWDEVLEPIAKWTGDKFLDFWDWLNKHLKNFGDYLNENKTAAKILGDIATALILMWGGTKVVKGGAKVVGVIREVIKWFHHLFKFITGSSIVKAIGSLFKGIGPAFGKAWGVIKVAFGKIGPALSKVWGAIKVLFGKIGPAFSKVWGVIKVAFGKIGPALSKVWGVIKLLFGKIGPLFTKLWGVIKAIGTAIMAGISSIAAALGLPVAAVVAIIAAITAAVTVIVIYWDEICAFCKKTWDKFTKWFSKTCKKIGKWFKELWQDIKSIWGEVCDWFTNLFKSAWAGIKKAWSGVKKWFSDLWTGIKNIWKEVTQWFSNLFKAAWEGIKKAWSTVKKWFTDLWNGIKNVWKEAVQWFTNLFKSAWEGIKNAWSTVKKWFTDLWEGIKNVWKEAVQWFTNLFKSAWDGIKNAWSTVKQWFTDLWTAIKNVWKEATQWFTNLFKSAWDGIKNAWSTVKQWFSDLWTSIKNVWKEVTQWFTNLFTSAWNGIKNAWSGVTSWFSSLWTSIKNVFSNVGSWFTNIFASAWSGIKSAWSGVTGWFSGIWTGIKNAFSNVGSWFTNIFASARDGIKNVWSSIKGFLTTPIENAKTTISNIISKMKGLFNFNWSLPRIKLPHFSISPSGWEFGDLLKGVIPKLGIEWYANGGIMTNPTAFGMNGNNLMVGGEAGAEAIVPLNTLWEQMDNFANKIVAGTKNGNDRPIDIRNELYLDGNKVADSVIKNINRQTKLNGRSPLK